MKKFVGMAAFGLIALFAGSTERAAAGSFSIGGIGNIGGLGRIGGLGGYIGRPAGLIGGWRRIDWAPGRRVYYGGGWESGSYYPEVRTAYYYDPAPTYYPTEQADVVTLRLRVPADARVWFGDNPTTVTGANREFVSPPLVPGHDYVYQLRVQWTVNGKPVERTQSVPVHAGDRINLNFDK